MIQINEISFFIFLFCVILYTVLMIIMKRSSKNSRYSIINDIYKNWVINRFKDQNLNVVVQGLRNIVMGNSIYSSALLILLGILAGLYESNFFNTDHSFLQINFLPLGLVKISLNAFIIIFSLLNFILAIRMMNRLTLLFCAYPEIIDTENLPGIQIMEEAFTSGQHHLFLGIRGIFFLIPSLLWIIHPIIFIILSIFVTTYLIFFHDLKKIKAIRLE